MSSSRSTQRGKILQLLIAARGEWVPLHTIANRTKLVNGARHSWFRLEPQTPIAVSPESKLPAQSVSCSFPEFGFLARESYGVD